MLSRKDKVTRLIVALAWMHGTELQDELKIVETGADYLTQVCADRQARRRASRTAAQALKKLFLMEVETIIDEEKKEVGAAAAAAASESTRSRIET